MKKLEAGHGEAGHGEAGHGWARTGEATQGKAGFYSQEEWDQYLEDKYRFEDDECPDGCECDESEESNETDDFGT